MSSLVGNICCFIFLVFCLLIFFISILIVSCLILLIGCLLVVMGGFIKLKVFILLKLMRAILLGSLICMDLRIFKFDVVRKCVVKIIVFVELGGCNMFFIVVFICLL